MHTRRGARSADIGLDSGTAEANQSHVQAISNVTPSNSGSLPLTYISRKAADARCPLMSAENSHNLSEQGSPGGP